MRDDDRRPPTDALVIEGADATTSRRRRALAQARRLGAAAAGEATARIVEIGREQVAPRLDAAVEWALAPERIERVQQLVAQATSAGVGAGFRMDPAARLLFELALWAEGRAGGLAVAQSLMLYNPALDGSLLALMQAHLQATLSPDAEPPAHALDAARSTFLQWVAYVVALATEVEPPTSRSPETLADWITRQPDLPPPLQKIPALAMGDHDAFESLAAEAARAEADTDADAQAEAKAPRGLRQRLLRRVTPGFLRADAPAQAADARGEASVNKKRGLARVAPGLGDPSVAFFTRSYLFFIQVYGSRAFIERLPELAHVARALDEAQAKAHAVHEPDAASDEPIILDLGPRDG